MAKIQPAQIPSSKRPRIEVSEEDRKAAMAGMGGEKTKAAGLSPAADAPSVPATEPVAPVAAPVAEVVATAPETVLPAVGLDDEHLATSSNEPALTAAPAPTAAPEPTPTAPAALTPAAASEPTPAPTAPAEPTPTAVAPAPVAVVDEHSATAAPEKPVAAAAPAARAAGTGRRGRPPRPVDAEPLDSEHSIKIAESTWNEIRLNLVLLPKSDDNPASIKKYLEQAHKHYEAHLRKQGKLPAK
jgi:hypothetical protein